MYSIVIMADFPDGDLCKHSLHNRPSPIPLVAMSYATFSAPIQLSEGYSAASDSVRMYIHTGALANTALHPTADSRELEVRVSGNSSPAALPSSLTIVTVLLFLKPALFPGTDNT